MERGEMESRVCIKRIAIQCNFGADSSAHVKGASKDSITGLDVVKKWDGRVGALKPVVAVSKYPVGRSRCHTEGHGGTR